MADSIPNYSPSEFWLSVFPNKEQDVPAPSQDTMYEGIPQQIAAENAKAGVALNPKPDWSKG